MNKKNVETGTPIDWDVYWRGSASAQAYTNEGTDHPDLQVFWRQVIEKYVLGTDSLKIVDVASGKGALINVFSKSLSLKKHSIFSLDFSEAAMMATKKSEKDICTIVADAKLLPIQDQVADVVISQFGVEYAGFEAIDEILRIVRPQGYLALVLHNRSGSIYNECSNNVKAIDSLEKLRFLPLAIDMFEAGFSLLKGGSKGQFERAVRKLKPAFLGLEPIMDLYGVDVAGGTISTLYNETAKIQGRLNHYKEDDVIDWLKKMEGELQSYLGRMNSMCRVAITNKQFKDIQKVLLNNGFDLLVAESLMPKNNSLPLAWAIIAKRK